MKKIYALLIFLTVSMPHLNALSFWDAILLRVSPDTLLFQATKNSNIGALTRCIGKTDINSYDWDGLTPLHYALLNNNPEVISLLIANGADINAYYKKGKLEYKKEDTLLHYAAENGDIILLERLIKYGADLKAVTEEGITPYIRAYEHSHQEICDILKMHGAYSILDAVRCGDIETTMRLLPENKNIITRGGDTLLHIAAIKGHLEIMKLLLAEGAGVNIRDNTQWAPLHTVIMQCRKPEAIQLLIQHGADVCTPDDKGWTPLHLAMLLPKLEIVTLLIAAGAPLNAKCKDGGTPLDLILSLPLREFLDEKQVVEYLRSLGAESKEDYDRNAQQK